MKEKSAKEKLKKEIREQIETLEALINNALGEKVRVRQESEEEPNPLDMDKDDTKT